MELTVGDYWYSRVDLKKYMVASKVTQFDPNKSEIPISYTLYKKGEKVIKVTEHYPVQRFVRDFSRTREGAVKLKIENLEGQITTLKIQYGV